MQIPKSISPNPTVSSTVEIRFTTSFQAEDVYQKVVPLFIQEFPKIDKGTVPQELIDKNELYIYAPEYIFRNDIYTIGIGRKSIIFEHTDKYTSWDEYYKFVKKSLGKVFDSNFIKDITRIGVRVGNMFDNEYDPSKILINIPKIDLTSIKNEFQGYQSLFNIDNNILFLQISCNSKVTIGNVIKSGLYVDIDASHNNQNVPSDKIYDIINKLYDNQQYLFYNLIKSTYIQDLNPKY